MSDLVLRRIAIDDQAELEQAHEELLADDFTFLFGWPDSQSSWAEYVELVASQEDADRVLPGWVPATFFLAQVDGQIVGRVSIRHELNDRLLQSGGHVGYCVRPAFRSRGYASQMLTAALEYLSAVGVDRVLVTCGDDNVASVATIERNGGELESIIDDADGRPTRRYWIANGG